MSFMSASPEGYAHWITPLHSGPCFIATTRIIRGFEVQPQVLPTRLMPNRGRACYIPHNAHIFHNIIRFQSEHNFRHKIAESIIGRGGHPTTQRHLRSPQVSLHLRNQLPQTTFHPPIGESDIVPTLSLLATDQGGPHTRHRIDKNIQQSQRRDSCVQMLARGYRWSMSGVPIFCEPLLD
jgi:hypothetical protein